MVLLGGLEIVAAGYLINKHQKNKREKERIEEELEEERQRRAARSEYRKARKSRSSSAPPPELYHPSSKSSKQNLWAHPPMKQQYNPRPAHSTAHLALPAPPPPPPSYNHIPYQAGSSTSSPMVQQHSRPSSYNAQHYVPPPQAQSFHALPSDAYELSADLYHNYPYGAFQSYSEEHIAPSQDTHPSGRRSRSNSRVRFALPVNGDESHLQVVEPGTPPPAYAP